MPKLEKIPFDVRLCELNLKRGAVSHRDIEKHIRELPDDLDNAEELVVYEEKTISETETESAEEMEASEPKPSDLPSNESPENSELS